MNIFQKHDFKQLRYLLLFFVILFGFHFLYSALINDDLMIPGLEGLYLWLRGHLYTQSAWVVEHVLRIGFGREEGFVMRFASGRGIVVDESCSAVKWFAHFLVMMIVFPGPWRHKLWYIPAGLLVTNLVNVVRVAGLALVVVKQPGAFDFFHDYVFRPLFYLVLFLMWVTWVEWFVPQRKRKSHAGCFIDM